MDEELLQAVSEAAKEEEVTLSAWLAEAARERLHLLVAQKVLDEWQEEHGPFTEEELAQADWDLDHPLDPKDVLREMEEREKEAEK